MLIHFAAKVAIFSLNAHVLQDLDIIGNAQIQAFRSSSSTLRRIESIALARQYSNKFEIALISSLIWEISVNFAGSNQKKKTYD